MAEINSAFIPIHTFVLSHELLEKTVASLRDEGRGRVESIAFWVGTIEGSSARVTHLLIPKGPGVFKHAYHIRVSEGIIAKLCDFVDPPHRILLGQVHTHKHNAFHSPTDDANSLDTPGYLSVVIPRFAAGAPRVWQDWVFHECIASKTFRVWPPAEAADRIHVVPAGEIEIHDVRG